MNHSDIAATVDDDADLKVTKTFLEGKLFYWPSSTKRGDKLIGGGGILQYFTNGSEEQLSVTQQIFTKNHELLQHVYSIEELCHDQELSQQ